MKVESKQTGRVNLDLPPTVPNMPAAEASSSPRSPSPPVVPHASMVVGARTRPEPTRRETITVRVLAGRRGTTPIGRGARGALERLRQAQVAGVDFITGASREILQGRLPVLIEGFELMVGVRPTDTTLNEQLHHLYSVAGRAEDAARVAGRLPQGELPRLLLGAASLAESSQALELAQQLSDDALARVSPARTVAEAVAARAREAAEQDPARADQAEARRQYADALAHLERQIRLFKGRNLISVGRTDQAFRTYEALHAEAPLPLDHVTNFARLALERGDVDRAAELADRPQPEAGDYPAIETYRKSVGFAAHAAAGRRQRALELWSEANALWDQVFGPKTSAQYNTGFVVAQNMIEGVLALGDKTVLLDAARRDYAREGQVALAHALSRALVEAGEISTAFELLENAVATSPEVIAADNPESVLAVLVRALAHLQRNVGSPEEALATLKVGFQKGRPETPEVRDLGFDYLTLNLERAGALGARSMDLKSVEAVHKALSKAWPVAKTFELRAQLLFLLRRFGEAIEPARRAAELAPEQPGLALLYGTCLTQGSRTEHHERAVLELRRALTLDPELHLAHHLIARTLLALGRYAEARQASRATLEANPTNLTYNTTQLEIELGALRAAIAAQAGFEPTAELAEDMTEALVVLATARSLIARAESRSPASEPEVEINFEDGIDETGSASPSSSGRGAFSIEAQTLRSVRAQAAHLEARAARLPEGLQKHIPTTRIERVVEHPTDADRERPPPRSLRVSFRSRRDGPIREGQLIGWTSHGTWVVKAEGKQYWVWEPTFLEQAQWPSAIESVPKAHRARPHGLYRELLDDALDRPVCGKHTAREFAKALGECFLVGGAVREALRRASLEEAGKVERFKPMRIDVDLVTSTTAKSAEFAGRQVARDVVGRNGELGGQVSDSKALSQATVRFADARDPSSPGVDISAIRVAGAYEPATQIPDGPMAIPLIAGRDLYEDALARDFTCNAIYYHPESGLLLDPTGHGIEDAQSRHLRITSDRYLEKNEAYALRFARFRLDGFTYERDTLEAMHKNARRFFEDKKAMVRKLTRLVPDTLRRTAAIESWLTSLVIRLQDDGFVAQDGDRGMDAAFHLRPLIPEVLRHVLAERSRNEATNPRSA